MPFFVIACFTFRSYRVRSVSLKAAQFFMESLLITPRIIREFFAEINWKIRKTNTKNRRKFIWKPPKLINIYGLRKNIKAKLVLSIESTWKAAQQFQFHLELNGNCLCKNEGYFGITSRHTKHFHKNFTTWWPKWMLFRWKLRPVWLLVLGHKHK